MADHVGHCHRHRACLASCPDCVAALAARTGRRT